MLAPVIFAAIFGATAALVGAVATITGFGIGSVLTPLAASQLGMSLAVAAVALPHFAGTVFRAWRMRREIDRDVFLGFGIASAVGGLAGALLQRAMAGPALGIVLGCLLIFAGLMEATGAARRLRFGGKAAWVAGIVSGGLGGLVGNQGGLRSGALLGFDVPKEAFVATATAVGVLVDLARLPVYLATYGREMLGLWLPIAAGIVGVLFGTIAGERVLRRIPETAFRRGVAAALIALGAAMLAGLGR